MAAKQPTMKAFREHLNKMYGGTSHSNNTFGNGWLSSPHFRPLPGRYYIQRKRLYGDYLYFQDREKFDVEFKAWIAGGCSATFLGTT